MHAPEQLATALDALAQDSRSELRASETTRNAISARIIGLLSPENAGGGGREKAPGPGTVAPDAGAVLSVGMWL